MDLLHGGVAYGQETIATDIREAYRLNPELVMNFLQEHTLAPFSFPQADFPEASEEERGAIATATAIEAANLAVGMADAILSLDPVRQTPRSAYAKIGPVIERCYGSLYASAPAGLDELLTLLLGEQRGPRPSQPRPHRD